MLKTSKLITANSWFQMSFLQFRATRIRKLLARHKLKDQGIDEAANPLVAFVNHGRWSITCPACGGGEYAWEEGYVMCCSCLNSYIGHRFRRLVFPTKRAEIEDILVERPLRNRNWNLGETVAQLRRENLEHAADLLPKEVTSDGLDDTRTT